MLTYTTAPYNKYVYYTEGEWQVRIYVTSKFFNVVLCRQSQDGLFHDENLCKPEHCETLEGAYLVAELMMGK